MDFLQVIETIKSEDASVRRLFGGEGRNISARARRLYADPAHVEQVAEAAKFVAEVLSGKRPFHHLQEAMTTDDFPILFGNVIDVTLLGGYREAPSTWKAYVNRNVVNDFRLVSRKRISGADGTLDPVQEREEYPEGSISEAEFSYSVTKFGRRLPLSWEMGINDNLGAFRNLIERLGKAARRTENRKAAELWLDANGPHPSLYTGGNDNIITGNPVLGVPGLQAGLAKLTTQSDEAGEPIVFEAAVLVVPPALEVQALAIINATEIETRTGSGIGTDEFRLRGANFLKNRVKVVVDHYIPHVATAGTVGSTLWALFADPSDGTPALELAFLRNHEEPELFIKEPNARRAGGGTVDPMDGDFDTDAIDYKVRHSLGGGRMEPRATVASDGSGS